MSINKDSQKAPNLRFKGFTDDWEERKLKDISEKLDYGLNAAAKSYDGINKYLRITDIDENSRLFNLTNLSSPDYDLEKADDYLLDIQDILFARTGASVGKTYKYKISDGKVYFAGFLIRARIKNNFNPYFVFQNTLTNKYYNYVKVVSQRSGQPGINSKEYGEFPLFIPKFEEQTKIGSFLKKLDNTITLHQRKLDQLKQLKEALLQQMFPGKGETVPKLRFAGFEGDWEERKFDEFLEEFIRKSKIENEFTTLSSTNSGMEVREGRVSGNTNIGYKIIENDDLVLSPQNLWLGNINLNYIGTGLVSPSYKTFKIKNLSSSFLKPQLRSKRLLNQYELASTQGASVVRRNLDMELFYQITLPVPVIQEQYKIGKLFKDLDDYIVLQSQKVNKLKSMKEVLLQNMFI